MHGKRFRASTLVCSYPRQRGIKKSKLKKISIKVTPNLLLTRWKLNYWIKIYPPYIQFK